MRNRSEIKIRRHEKRASFVHGIEQICCVLFQLYWVRSLGPIMCDIILYDSGTIHESTMLGVDSRFQGKTLTNSHLSKLD